MRKTIAIMQPYFFPYIGYWQLLQAVDSFIVYDNIQYSKKGWINRNRYLLNGNPEIFSIPIKKDSDYLDINKRVLIPNFTQEADKLLRKIQSSYKKAPHFNHGIALFEECLRYESLNLFDFIYHSIKKICTFLQIDTPIITSSSIPCNQLLKGEERVIQICKTMNAENYINPIGGLNLYDKENFGLNNINLKFLKCKQVKYQQFGQNYCPSLSILDVIMFCGKTLTQDLLQEYELT